MFGVAGCPRCPLTVASAVGATVARAGKWWGPPAFLKGAEGALRRADGWLLARTESAIAGLGRR
eukprot:15433941-Alexandrium_andersonii.AAC.1